MPKRIVRVSPMQAGKVLAIFYAILSLPFALIMSVSSALKGKGGFPLIVAVIFPLLYLVFGFLLTAFSAWLYNHVAKWTGGIEFETAEQPDIQESPR